ncbi:hypothetical protein VB715_00365 [Crocosphaera sp. UHCC 0190]|uniref:hypothetical protein n=1 Tax=Crocosphaera sp. UHCC 0190 TaxID=3110246 RepID=UPI002B1F9071|nr:hypothetical protein [Crocosphaera sp. UHCC 0190]MEA5508207.1 hypothetical protein [Crocosphaera sp. UHCC 0190]
MTYTLDRPKGSQVSPQGSYQTALINPSVSSNTKAESNCNTCVDDYSIPPCTGFSKDYSCLPNLSNLTP